MGGERGPGDKCLLKLGQETMLDKQGGLHQRGMEHVWGSQSGTCVLRYAELAESFACAQGYSRLGQTEKGEGSGEGLFSRL